MDFSPPHHLPPPLLLHPPPPSRFASIRFTYGEVEDLKGVLGVFTSQLESGGFAQPGALALAVGSTQGGPQCSGFPLSSVRYLFFFSFFFLWV